MTYDELKNLPKFEISNEYGSIKFYPIDATKGGIDITEVDLMDVEINSKEVIVYGRFDNHQASKPKLGEKLNLSNINYRI